MSYSSVAELSDLIINKLSSIVEKSGTSEDMLLLAKSVKEVFNVTQDAVDLSEASTAAKESAKMAHDSEAKVAEIYNKTVNTNFNIPDTTKEYTEKYNEVIANQISLATNLIITQKLFVERCGLK